MACERIFVDAHGMYRNRQVGATKLQSGTPLAGGSLLKFMVSVLF